MRPRHVTVAAAAAGAAVGVCCAAAIVGRRWSGTPDGTGADVGHRWARLFRLGLVSAKSARTYAVAGARGAFASAERREALIAQAHLESAEQIAETLGNMKGAMMKLAQIASFALVGLPDDVQAQLATLQSNSPPMSFELVAGVLRDEFGAEPDEAFAWFDREPSAAASIGQVHRARLHDGTPVAVKVQYPGAAAAIRADLDNGVMLQALGRLLGADLGPLIDELRERLVEELDYECEAANQRAFAELHAGHPFVVVPRVYDDLSSGRVLTMDWIDGFTLDDTDDLDPVARNELAEKLCRFVFDSLYRHHVFNGDPHPGNYLFLADGRIAFLDFGCIKYFRQDELDVMERFLLALRTGDPATFRAMLAADGFLRDGATTSDRDLFDIWHSPWRHMTSDTELTITTEFVHETQTQMLRSTEIADQCVLPPGMVLLSRITIGLNAIFARLGATQNWYRIAGEYVDGTAPSTPLGEAVAQWRAERNLADVQPAAPYTAPPDGMTDRRLRRASGRAVTPLRR